MAPESVGREIDVFAQWKLAIEMVIHTADDLDKVEWITDPTVSRSLNIVIVVPEKSNLKVHLWIEPRPPYCDRGHWLMNIDSSGGPNWGGLETDASDGFPRYFMDLERAIAEGIDFLKWRIFKVGAQMPNPTQPF